MATKAQDPHFKALDAVYSALKELDDAGRKRVLASVYAILGISSPVPTDNLTTHSEKRSAPFDEARPTSLSRPTSLVETMTEKKPGTNAQRIAVFAYHREKSEGQTRFAREDLKPYFAKARVQPASNYDRDFGEAVKRGWIHEDGNDSYLTTRGIEAVESGFEGERKYTQHTTKVKVKKKAKAAARSRRK